MAITIYDIAAKADVSIATVSRVLNNHPRVSAQTRRRVLEIAGEAGYQPHAFAQGLARRRGNLIAAIVPMLTSFFFIEVLRGVQDRLAESEYDLLVLTVRSPEEVEDQMDRVLQKGLAAGVLLFSSPLTEAAVERLLQIESAVVLVDTMHDAFDSVFVNNETGGYLATHHLIEHGRKRIGLILGHPASVPAAQRRFGYEHAMSEAGLRIDSRLIYVSDEQHHHGFTEEAGFAGMNALLKTGGRPDAVFVSADIQALGALRALQEHDVRCPEEVALIGFDDVQISRFIGLSTLRQPMFEMGQIAVDKLLTRMRFHDHPTSHTVFSPSLVCRATCGGQAPIAEATMPLSAKISIPVA